MCPRNCSELLELLVPGTAKAMIDTVTAWRA
jgi:hypothetical protein